MLGVAYADFVSLSVQVGGYSGPQMFERTLDLVRRYRGRLDDDKVIFASGGITNGKQCKLN